MDREILKYYIEEYKEDFDRINQDEIYKWYIVAKFQKNWDIEAVDFYNMLNKALVDYVQTPFAKVANNLICSNNFYPKSVLLEFVKNATEKPNYIGAGIMDADYIDVLDPDVWEERHNTFKELLAYLMNDKGGAIATQKQLSIFEAELSKNVIIEQNLNKSFETFDDGVIPELFIKRVVSVQNTIQQLRAEITKLKASLNTNKTDLRIYSTDDILRLYETEQGRLELNNFFVVNEISFVFDYIKETRTLIGKVLHKGHFIQWVEKKFPLHNPLVKEYGIQNINKIAETSNGFQYSKD